MPTHVVRAVLLTLAVALIAWAPADAESGRRAGIVTAVSGTATVTRASLRTPHALRFRDDVMLHDRIATGEQSIARILLGGKAVITVRERSVVTITESPRISTVDVETGKVAVAVAKERMRPGESIDLRTPNAVAGIRGTVVIAEVSRKGAAASTRFTLLTGLIEVARLDAARRPIAPAAFLTPLQTIVIDGALSPVRHPITRSDGASASAQFGIPMKSPARSGADWIANDQVKQAAAIIDPDRRRAIGAEPDRNRGAGRKADRERRDGGDDDRGRRTNSAFAPGSSSTSPSDDDDSAPGSISNSSTPRDGGSDVRQDVKPDKGGKASQDAKPDKVKGPPIALPTTPVVPPSALQPSGDGKGKGKEKDGKRG